MDTILLFWKPCPHNDSLLWALLVQKIKNKVQCVFHNMKTDLFPLWLCLLLAKPDMNGSAFQSSQIATKHS